LNRFCLSWAAACEYERGRHIASATQLISWHIRIRTIGLVSFCDLVFMCSHALFITYYYLSFFLSLLVTPGFSRKNVVCTLLLNLFESQPGVIFSLHSKCCCRYQPSSEEEKEQPYYQLNLHMWRLPTSLAEAHHSTP
jgi:hypothetical protein